MSNTLFKKVTASVAALSVVLSIVSPVTGVKAADAGVEAANRLASLGVIVDSSSNPNAYNLGSSITRREMLKVMMNLSSVEVTDTCTGKFSDLPKTDWGCKYAEAALNAGFIAANPKFRPNDLVTEAEALKMIMQARGVAKAEGVADWAEAYRQAAVAAGVIAEGSKVSTTTSAKRSFVFVSADSAVTSSTTDNNTSDDSDVNLDDLFGDLFDDNGTDATNSGSTTDEDTTSDDEDDTTDTTSNVKAGDLEVSLSADTAAADSLPDSAEGVEVASFDLTAGDEDIKVSSVKLTRKGLGADDAVSNVALFAEGTRVSKARSFNSSDDTADVALSPALVVKAGETVTLVAKVNTNNVTSSKKFSVELTEITSSAANVEGAPVTSEQFEVQDTAATVITLSNDGTVTDPKLGAEQAEVLKFKVKNDTTSAEDVTFKEITLKEDGTIDEDSEIENVALYYNGDKVADAVSNGTKYFTFSLEDGITIKDGKTEKFVVKADIVGGAADTIDFTLDNDLDVTASASKYGYVSVAGSVDTDALTVEAGEVTLTAVDPSVTDVREDKDDVVLGTLKVAPKSKELELSKVKFTVESVNGNINNVLENFELYDETSGVKYDLTSATSGNNVVLTETDLAIMIDSEKVFVVRADTKNPISGFDAYDFRLTMTLDTNNDSTINASDVGFVLKETGDDELVTDVTPSTLTWKTINGQESSASVSTIVMSDSTSVIGSKGVEVAQFQISADDSSALTFTEAKVHLAVATAADAKAKTQTITFAASADDGDKVVIDGTTYEFDTLAANNGVTSGNTEVQLAADTANGSASALQAAISSTLATATVSTNVVTVTNRTKGDTPTVVADITKTDADNDYAIATSQASVGTKATSSQVSAIYLYNGTTLLDQVSGSQLSNGQATFDGFKQTIAKNGKVTYIVKIDLVDDTNQGTKRIAASVQSVDVEDEDSDDVVASGLPGNSARDLTISGVGTLAITVDNTDTETDKAKNVIANGTSPFVASYELTATNEAIKVKDLEVVATESTADDFVNSVSEVVLYKNDKTTELDREPVTSTTVTFDNVNYVVSEGNTNLYVKVVTRKIGKDSAGVQTADITLAIQATDVEGNSSGKAVTTGAGVASDTSASNAFAVVPVKISALSFVSSYGGETVASTLTNGENTVGIIAVTTDSSSNTKTDGTSLKTELESLALALNTDAVYDGDNNTAAADFRNVTIKKINGVTSAQAVTKLADGTTAFTEEATPATMNILKGVDLGSDEELENGTTTYFVVKASFSGLQASANKYFQLKLDGLDTGSVEYSSNNSDDDSAVYNAADNISKLRIGTTSISGPSLSSNY